MQPFRVTTSLLRQICPKRPQQVDFTSKKALNCKPSLRYNSQQSEARTSASTEPHQQSSSQLSNQPATGKAIRLTSESYPNLSRDSRYKEIDKNDIKHFRSILDNDAAILDGTSTSDVDVELESYNSDWMRKFRGQSRLVLSPNTTEQVSQILKYCNEKRLAVVPQGGNTGLVGGSTPVFDEIVISLSRMNKFRSFDNVSGILVCDAGTVLENADNYLRERDHVFPLDLGAKGTCQVGGCVATNAGGLRLLRYGSLHGNVLGLEVVLPDGTIVDDLSTLRKNNTGYDIKQLFIGSEGTIGIVTGVSIVCPQRSAAINVAYLGLSTYEHVQNAFKEAKKQLGEILSAFELMDLNSQRIFSRVTGTKLPLESEHDFYVLIETSGSDTEHDASKLERYLESVMEAEVVADGVVAQDGAQQAELWKCREGITETLGHWGAVYKYDLSIPIKDMYSLVAETRLRMSEAGLLDATGKANADDKPVVDIVGYGHMGDANIHLNIAARKWDKRVEAMLEPFVYEWVGQHKGSISAEHGLGLAKKAHVGYSKSPTMISLMQNLKTFYDPVSGTNDGGMFSCS